MLPGRRQTRFSISLTNLNYENLSVEIQRLSTVERCHQVSWEGDWPLRARLCARPQKCQKSASVQTQQKSFGWEYNNNNVQLSCARELPERSHDNINQNTIFYTHAEHSPSKTIYYNTPSTSTPNPLLYIRVVSNMSARHKKTLSLICIACVFANQKSHMHKLIIPQSLSELVDYENTTTTQLTLQTCVGTESVREGRRTLYTQ